MARLDALAELKKAGEISAKEQQRIRARARLGTDLRAQVYIEEGRSAIDKFSEKQAQRIIANVSQEEASVQRMLQNILQSGEAYTIEAFREYQSAIQDIYYASLGEIIDSPFDGIDNIKNYYLPLLDNVISGIQQESTQVLSDQQKSSLLLLGEKVKTLLTSRLGAASKAITGIKQLFPSDVVTSVLAGAATKNPLIGLGLFAFQQAGKSDSKGNSFSTLAKLNRKKLDSLTQRADRFNIATTPTAPTAPTVSSGSLSTSLATASKKATSGKGSSSSIQDILIKHTELLTQIFNTLAETLKLQKTIFAAQLASDEEARSEASGGLFGSLLRQNTASKMSDSGNLNRGGLLDSVGLLISNFLGSLLSGLISGFTKFLKFGAISALLFGVSKLIQTTLQEFGLNPRLPGGGDPVTQGVFSGYGYWKSQKPIPTSQLPSIPNLPAAVVPSQPRLPFDAPETSVTSTPKNTTPLRNLTTGASRQAIRDAWTAGRLTGEIPQNLSFQEFTQNVRAGRPSASRIFTPSPNAQTLFNTQLPQTSPALRESLKNMRGMTASNMRAGLSGASLAKAGPWAAIGAGIDFYNRKQAGQTNTQAAAGAGAGALGGLLGAVAGGAATGAALGTVVPGIGNLAGAVIGGVVGVGSGILGAYAASSAADALTGANSLSEPAPNSVGNSYAPVSGGTGEWTQDKDFLAEIDRISQKYNINANDLLSVMAAESGLNPQAVNPNSGATGLIQFMPTTAQALGTSVGALHGMSRAEQMQYVDKYFERNQLPKGASAGMIYATIFLPARKNNNVLTQQGESYYNANQGLDLNRDSRITVDELSQQMARKGTQFGIGATKASVAGGGGGGGWGGSQAVTPTGDSTAIGRSAMATGVGNPLLGMDFYPYISGQKNIKDLVNIMTTNVQQNNTNAGNGNTNVPSALPDDPSARQWLSTLSPYLRDHAVLG